jgi:hypothetical protein
MQPLAGLWIVEGKEMFYNQLSHVTFMCPMKFNKFPLDRLVFAFNKLFHIFSILVHRNFWSANFLAKTASFEK